MQLKLGLIFSAPSRKAETNCTSTHTQRIEGNVIFSPEGMKSNIIIRHHHTWAFLKRSCHCQLISPSLVGHFPIFIFRDFENYTQQSIAWEPLIPQLSISSFFLFPGQLDKHWDRDIIYEYSFCQTKIFPHYKQGQLTRIQLAEGRMTFWTLVLHSVNWPLYKVLKEGKGHFQKRAASRTKGSYTPLGSSLHPVGQCGLSPRVCLLNAVSEAEACRILFWRIFLLAKDGPKGKLLSPDVLEIRF